MLERRVADTIELDQLLRAARNFYFIAALITVPIAIVWAVSLAESIPLIIAHLFGEDVEDISGAVWNTVLGSIVILLAFFEVAQYREAKRRIEHLAEDATARVKPMYVPGFMRTF